MPRLVKYIYRYLYDCSATKCCCSCSSFSCICDSVLLFCSGSAIYVNIILACCTYAVAAACRITAVAAAATNNGHKTEPYVYMFVFMCGKSTIRFRICTQRVGSFVIASHIFLCETRADTFSTHPLYAGTPSAWRVSPCNGRISAVRAVYNP